MSEWLKVMLEEIARKRADAEQAFAEQLRRRDERGAPAAADPNLDLPANSDAGSADDGSAEAKRR